MRTLAPCFYNDLVSLATWLSRVQQTRMKSSGENKLTIGWPKVN